MKLESLWLSLLLCLLVAALPGCLGYGSNGVDDDDSADDDDAADDDDSADQQGADSDGDGSPDLDDCNDEDPLIHPGATEVCDNIDNDCDGATDESDAEGAPSWYQDVDGDGYGVESESQRSCNHPHGYSAYSGDCNDDDPAFHPGAGEADCTDPNDYNCDGAVGYTDGDADGFAACADCDDAAAAVNSAASELCDAVDNDCDGETDEADASDVTPWSPDADEDGYGDGSVVVSACSAPDGYVGNSDDCNDAEPLAWTGASETCDEADNNCDGSVDEGVTTVFYTDADGDGHGDAAAPVAACALGAGLALNSSDCDDAAAETFPGSAELEINSSDCMTDGDGDGYGADNATGAVVAGSDCDDLSGSINPSQTDVVGDATDQNCDGTDGTDSDGDGFASAASGGTDCDDANSSIQASTDSDGDGFDCNADCDDNDTGIYPGATDLPEDGIDQNCDGSDAAYGTFLADVNITTDAAANFFCTAYNQVSGNLNVDLSNLSNNNTSFLDCVEYVGGQIYIQSNSNSVISFASLEEVGDSLNIQQGAASYSFPVLTTVGSYLELAPDFAVFDGDLSFPSLETVVQNLQINNSSATEVTGFSALTSLRSLYISNNSNLSTISGFDALESVSESLEIRDNSSLTSVSGFAALESARYFYLYDHDLLDTVTGFGALESVQQLNVYDNPLLPSSVACRLIQPNTTSYNINNLLDTFDLNACDVDDDGFTPLDGDCDDGNEDSFPGAVEACDAQDNDCDGTVPPGEIDADGDGYLACADDCDDNDAAFNPGAPDICDDQLDQNCDGADSSSTDGDGDGISSCDGDCDDSDPSNTSLLGSISCPAGNCLAIASTDLVNAGDAVYHVSLADGSVAQVYCEMGTAGGGWTLFAITDSDECAENLDYGSNELTSISAAPYITTLLQDEVHSNFLQVFQADGSTTDFTIVYAFSDGPETLSGRFDSAVAAGVGVAWTVNHQGSSYNLSGTWRYSNGANTSTRWSGSGGNFSDDDGSWGAASGVVDGNSPGPPLNGRSDAWGHENPDSGDSQCEQYHINGNQSSSSSLRNYMFYR